MSDSLVHWCLGFGGWMGLFLGVGFACGLPKDMGYERYLIALSMPFVLGITTLLVAQASIAFSTIIILTLKSMYSVDTMMSVIACLCCSLAIAFVVLGSLMIIQLGRFNRVRKDAEGDSRNETHSESDSGEEGEEGEESVDSEEGEEGEESVESEETVEAEEGQEIVESEGGEDGEETEEVEKDQETVESEEREEVVEAAINKTIAQQSTTMVVDQDVMEAVEILELMKSIDRDINKPIEKKVDMEEMD
jgi:hypothetical protein